MSEQSVSDQSVSELTDHMDNISLKPLRVRQKLNYAVDDNNEFEVERATFNTEEVSPSPRNDDVETVQPTQQHPIYFQNPRPPRLANSNNPPGYRIPPRDQYWTPRGPIVLLLNCLVKILDEHTQGSNIHNTKLHFLMFFLVFIGKRLPIFEPACGVGHISKVCREFGFTVIKQDLYSDYVSEHIDYLNSDDPLYGFLITNPPYGDEKFKFLLKAFRSGLPFAMLVSMSCLGTIRGSDMFNRYPLMIFMFRRAIKFDHDGRPAIFTNMAWFVGNVRGRTEDGFMLMRYIEDYSIEITQDESDIVSLHNSFSDVDQEETEL